MFKGALKGDLREIATELNLKVDEKMTVVSLNELIETSDIYKTKPDFVKELASSIIENRKIEEQRIVEIERIKLQRSQNELELAKIKDESKTGVSESEVKCESLDQIIKSIKTLTVKVPTRPEGWGLFFNSLERAFSTKNVLEGVKAEILLNLIGDKASNIITYLQDKDLTNYEKLKTLVLKEFEPTAYSCLENFRKTSKQPHETHVQFASRLITSWDYYLKLRKVSDFETLKELIVSDKIYQTLDKETASFISVRQGDKWFSPSELGKEIDLFFTSRGKNIIENTSVNRRYNRNTNVFLSEVKIAKCSLCNSNEKHGLYVCPQFKRLSVRERIAVLKRNKACFKCLNYNCSAQTCRSRNCFCGLPHNTLIHYSKEENQNNRDGIREEKKSRESLSHDVVNNSNPLSETNHSIVASGFIKTKTKSVLLSTARILIKNKFSEYKEIRCLLDVGSQTCLLTSQCANNLQLKINKTNTLISCLDDAVMTVKGSVEATISNRNGSFERKIDMLVVKKITELIPQRMIKVRVDEEISNLIELADNRFNVPDRVDMLLGAEIFYELLRPGQIVCPNSKLLLQNTVFGYVASGCVEHDNEVKNHCGLIKNADKVQFCGLIIEDNLNETLKKFWEIEDVDVELTKSKEHALCEEHFANTHFRDDSGQYVVNMPLKENPSSLGQSRDIALKRLQSLWPRLLKDTNYCELYRKFLKEYEELGHMRLVQETKEPNVTYYAPHHGVYRPEKSTTKLRVVFNCSSKTSNGTSLNSIQLNGGVIQRDLFSIMLGFREHAYAFTADVKMMYRMIKINPNQYPLQRIVWSDSPDEKPKTYELLTVTYGTVSAPYLAMRTLLQLSNDEEKKFPKAAPVLREQFYMDDVLTGAPTKEEAEELKRQLIAILNEAGMTLHKWFTNFTTSSVVSETGYTFDKGDVETKTLGVSWNPKEDSFIFRVKVDLSYSYTKRKVLSTIAKIFDPLGLLGPAIAKAKMFMQKLWRLNLDWNDALPEKENEEWHQFLLALKCINDIKVKRRVLIDRPSVVEIHGFGDASELGYGAAVFCKSVDEEGNVMVNLVTSKSRVAPIKSLTIPRLELCAAVLLTKLVKKVLAAMKVTVNTVHWWSDSTIVLAWIRKDPIDLKQFVRSRVCTIQENSDPLQWRHISSEQNPADVLSRGMDPDKLMNCSLWWNGPCVLMNNDYPCPSVIIPEANCDFNIELKNHGQMINEQFIFSVNINEFITNLLSLSNNYVIILRIFSFILRFVKNCREPLHRNRGPLSTEELQTSEECLLKLIQHQNFSADIKGLQLSGSVAPKSKLKSLNPFLDEKGVLRVGGRLGNASLNYYKKHPAILPPNNKLAVRIITYYHLKYLHVGASTLLSLVREKFWPINGRSMCRKVVHQCIPCFKAKPIVANQIMGDLPKDRVQLDYCFNVSGVDLCGPFSIKVGYARRTILQKIYICIFVCFIFKAVHIEIISDLTSESFIAALKRFIARRGKCSRLYSDNATNFTGANNLLRDFLRLLRKPDEKLATYLANEEIEWKFIPPRSPNFGGLWEAAVKAFKYHFKRVVGGSNLTYEEMLTVITQIEAVLNSRPLCPLTANEEDFGVLTPAHFMINRSLNSVIEPDLKNINENRLKKWQKISKLVQLFWQKWRLNYLSEVQQRGKWRFDKDDIKIGDMVLLVEENVATNKWPLGKIIEVYHGIDGKIRVVKVKTQNGTFKRAISKICILPSPE